MPTEKSAEVPTPTMPMSKLATGEQGDSMPAIGMSSGSGHDGFRG